MPSAKSDQIKGIIGGLKLCGGRRAYQRTNVGASAWSDYRRSGVILYLCGVEV
jgi:hypothetical protein